MSSGKWPMVAQKRGTFFPPVRRVCLKGFVYHEVIFRWPHYGLLGNSFKLLVCSLNHKLVSFGGVG